MHRFKVKGPGPFPVDMFRVSHCWPVDVETSQTIVRSLVLCDLLNLPTSEVEVESEYEPTPEDWEARGWAVVA